ncbi:hypothetical protein [Novosphingobium sp. FKTRR1]|uniref:hypothetical protein n=1 Tax=unclassified Novosphingobium TaxID=2644732 RepID=UPI001CEFC798|nr:hypothetical protein [Novosphingobium sp. FKTRR1]
MTDKHFTDEIVDQVEDVIDAANEATADGRARLREKIDEAKDRSAELAGNAAQKARDFVHDHPVATVAGGIVLGAIVAGALARRRRSDHRSVAARAVQAVTDAAGPVVRPATNNLAKLAAIGAELAIAYAARAADKGKESVEKLEEIGGTVSDRLSERGTEARKHATDLAEAALARANEFLGKLRH